MLRYAGTLSAMLFAEFTAHLLSIGWGFTVLLAAFAWVSLSGATVAAKARSTENRLNSVIPTIFPNTGGTIHGSVTVNGAHSVNGNMSVSGSHTVGGQVNSSTLSVAGNATTAGNHTVHGSLFSDNSVTAGGGFSGGSMHVSGNAQADGSFSAGSVSTGHYDGSSIHVSGNALADGSFSAGNFSGSYHGNQGGVSTVSGAPGSYSSSYETSLASAINGIISRLNSAGIT